MSKLMYRLKAFTGPTAVKEVAEKLKDAGMTAPATGFCGTENVYVEVEAIDLRSAYELLWAALRGKHGDTLNWLTFRRA